MAEKLDKWLEARKRHKLSDRHVAMARELGLNPTKLGKIDNHGQETWKAPLPQFIEKIYYKRFKREEPLCVKPIEEQLVEERQKKEKRKKEKEKKRKAILRGEIPAETLNVPACPQKAGKQKISIPVQPVIKPRLESGDSPETILQKESFLFDMAFDIIARQEASLSELGFVLKKIHPRYKPRRYGYKTLGAIYEKLGKYELTSNSEIGVANIVKRIPNENYQSGI